MITLTETWLNSSFGDAELNLPDYNIYRRDRKPNVASRGGGVLVAVHKKYNSLEIDTPDDIEQVFVMVNYNSVKLIIGCTYIPPRSGLNTYLNFTETVENTFDIYPEHKFLLLGDFNLPYTRWFHDDSVTKCEFVNANNTEIDCSLALLNTINYVNLLQVNDITNANDRSLDLVFLNNFSDTILKCNNPVIDCDSHHPALEIYMSISESISNLQSIETTYDFARADYVLINEKLADFDWLTCFENNDILHSVQYFYSFVNNIIENHVPKRKIMSSNYPCWYSNELKKLIINKKIAHKNYKIFQTERHYVLFSDFRRLCKNRASVDYKNYIMKTENSIKSDIKSFWKFCNEKRGVNGIPSTVTHGDTSAGSGQEIVDMFANYFESVYIPDDQNFARILDPIDNPINLNNITISLQDVSTAIQKLNVKKGAGPDGIPPLFLVNCMSKLTPLLHFLFNKSLHEGILPPIWKQSSITPIFKSGSRSKVENYRPISILSSIPKLFESIITSKLYPLLNNILIEQQHGFKQKLSTTSNLMSFLHYTLENLNENLQVDTIYTDFSKAFDSVCHNILISKLRSIGLHGSLLCWLSDYLTGRCQNVKYKSFISRNINVYSGVPQGSHLGPLLFLIFINDIGRYLSCKFLLFADDLKLFSVIKTKSDCNFLQANLDALLVWCRTNRLNLNIKKCKFMCFTGLRSPIKLAYKIGNDVVEQVEHFKDLGVTFDPKLKFSIHIDNIVNKASKMLGFVKRMTAEFQNPNVIKILYFTLIRPILLYASPIWSPFYDVHITKIESIQHKFLNYVAFKLKHTPLPSVSHDYSLISSTLKLSSLKSHRTYNDISFFYKLLSNEMICPELSAKILTRNPPRNLRNQRVTFITPLATLNTWYNAPLWRMCRFANDSNIDFHNLTLAEFTSQFKTLILSDYS